ncbi:MAG: PQQ-binding-like beta-propeller repeat protein [Candidatus Altiarchaeales archaeon]|nr:PQQ-binding-like beta-propeller repeat protein [Candidatus Altiarchaeales archaeon]MBD3417220.1 PQQ-binding-like beta-propeller repeat protein [Candidatus Altiarchaeales archaeon]
MKKPAYALALLLLTGCVTASPPMMWEFRARGSIYTDVIVEDSIVYFGSSGGILYALNKSTGHLIWNYTSTAGIYSTPAITDDMLIFGCDNHIVYAVNKSNGHRIWTFLTEDKIRSSPTVSDGVVYVGSDDGNLYALKESSGKHLWNIYIGYRIQSRPLTEDWKFYFGAADRKAYAASKITGGLLWNISARGLLNSDPAMYKDIIYFTSSDKRIYALDKYTGDHLWNFTTNGSLQGDPIVSGENVIFASRDTNVYSLNSYFGDLVWATSLNESVYATPLVQDGRVYVGAGDIAYELDEKTGEVLMAINASGRIRQMMAVSDGIYYIPSGSYLRAYGGTPEIGIADVRVGPRIPVAGRPFNINVTLKNYGNAIAADFIVDVYLDRENISNRKITLRAGQERTISVKVSAVYGSHLLEVILDPDEEVIESNKSNNRLGVVFTATSDWPTFQMNRNRTGSYNLKDDYDRRHMTFRWTCKLNTTNHTLRDVTYLLEHLNTTDRFSLEDFVLNHTCYTYQSRGYPIPRIFSNWSCTPTNVNLTLEDNFNDIRKYLMAHAKAQANSTLKNHMTTHGFNITDFEIDFKCKTTGNDVIPLAEEMLRWKCRGRTGFEPTPNNLSEGWTCSTTYYSNYSLQDLTEMMGYGLADKVVEKRRKITLKDFTLLWEHISGGKITASPLAVDLDGSGDGMLEVLTASYDGYVTVLGSSGSVKWTTDLKGKVHGISAHDLEGDGLIEILAGLLDGRVLCLNHTGDVRWEYATGGPVTSTPMAHDVDSTPELEVVFGSGDEYIYAIDYMGMLVWSYPTTDDVISTPALGDVDGDGTVEIIVGTRENTVYALNTPPYKLWMYQTNGDLIGAPTVAHTYSTRSTDIIIASADGSLYDLYKTSAGQEDMTRVCGPDGCERVGVAKTRLKPRWVFTTEDAIESSPAVEDLDGDGKAEIVFGSTDHNIYVINSSGERLMRYTTGGPIRSSPAIADLDYDGFPEIILGGDEGKLYVMNLSGVALWTFKQDSFIRSSPAIADIDNDGVLEVIVGCDSGRTYVFGLGSQDAPGQKPTSTTVASVDPTTTTLAQASSTTLMPAETTTTTVEDKVTTSTTVKPKMTSTTVAAYSPYEDFRFPSNKVDLLALTLFMSIMGYFFFMIIHPRPRWARKSRLKDY